MRYDLPSFDNKLETWRCCFAPPLQGGFPRQPIERALQLNERERQIVFLLGDGESAAPCTHFHARTRYEANVRLCN
jgi:hypothetical protein